MYISTNPFTDAAIWKSEDITDHEALEILSKAHKTYAEWSFSDLSERKDWVVKLATELRKNTGYYANWITREMGKPIAQSEAEVEKCAWLCEYYGEHFEDFLSGETHHFDEVKYLVRPEPLGVVLGIMPWNYPFWQAFRYSVPAILAGNTSILKPASNVGKCGALIEEAYRKAGLPDGVFQTAFATKDQVKMLIEDDRVKAVSLTGSDRAGSIIASMAGAQLMPMVMELGGSDVFVVMDDAELEDAANTFVQARLNNTGQTCIAAKRLLVHNDIKDDFIPLLRSVWDDIKMGDPMDRSNDISCLCRDDIATQLQSQLDDAINKGAQFIAEGGKVEDSLFFKPALITGVNNSMRAYSEELFGPVGVVYPFGSRPEAIEEANRSQFGLGAAIFSKSADHIDYFTRRLEAGHVAVNKMVSSDPRVPFGGIKRSGFGRELGKEGILEFTNLKTISYNS